MKKVEVDVEAISILQFSGARCYSRVEEVVTGIDRAVFSSACLAVFGCVFG